MMLQIPQSKKELTKVFSALQAVFGIHLIPLFYSGSIDLVVQNLFILMLGKLIHSKQSSARLMKLNSCFVVIFLSFKRGAKVIFNMLIVHHIENTKRELSGRTLDLIIIKTVHKIPPINVWRTSSHAPTNKT